MSAELEFAAQPSAATADENAQLRDSLTALARTKQRILIAIDEILHLATSPKFDRLAFALRTQLDTLGSRVSVFFTGSSWAGLARTFAANDMPFFQSAQEVPFPDMGKEFVEHTMGCYERLTGVKLPLEELMRFHESHGFSPFHLQSLVKRMVVAGYSNLTVAQLEQIGRIEKTARGKYRLLQG